MTTPRERALERLAKVAPHLPNAGAVVNELVAAYEVVEVATDLVEAQMSSVEALDSADLAIALKRFDEATVTG